MSDDGTYIVTCGRDREYANSLERAKEIAESWCRNNEGDRVNVWRFMGSFRGEAPPKPPPPEITWTPAAEGSS